MAGAAGFEPATLGFGDRCSTKLSYAPAPNNYNFSGSTSCGQTFNTCRQSLSVVALYEVKVQNFWMKTTQRTVGDLRFRAKREMTWMNALTRRTCTYGRACSAECKVAPGVACPYEVSLFKMASAMMLLNEVHGVCYSRVATRWVLIHSQSSACPNPGAVGASSMLRSFSLMSSTRPNWCASVGIQYS